MKKKIHAYILTFCRNPELFYGTELIFKTLRIGFPTANITVVDNGSLQSVRGDIERLALENDCGFRQINNPGMQHHEFIMRTIHDCAHGDSGHEPLVFLDPDICFWESCEDFVFDGIISGRLVGRFYDSYTHTITMPRLHTSFLWIPDTYRLLDEIRKIQVRRFDFAPFTPFSFRLDDTWYRYDTGASLYAAIPDKISFFTEDHLNRYDHIFCGSHLDWILPHYEETNRTMMEQIHSHAKNGDLKLLRGIWKYQDRAWEISQQHTTLNLSRTEVKN